MEICQRSFTGWIERRDYSDTIYWTLFEKSFCFLVESLEDGIIFVELLETLLRLLCCSDYDLCELCVVCLVILIQVKCVHDKVHASFMYPWPIKTKSFFTVGQSLSWHPKRKKNTSGNLLCKIIFQGQKWTFKDRCYVFHINRNLLWSYIHTGAFERRTLSYGKTAHQWNYYARNTVSWPRSVMLLNRRCTLM